jgi:hypothetical protein
MFEGALNSFPLGIEHCLFRRDNDLCFHSIDFEHGMSNGNGRMVKANFSRCVHFSRAAMALNRQGERKLESRMEIRKRSRNRIYFRTGAAIRISQRLDTRRARRDDEEKQRRKGINPLLVRVRHRPKRRN